MAVMTMTTVAATSKVGIVHRERRCCCTICWRRGKKTKTKDMHTKKRNKKGSRDKKIVARE